ncbi:MAG: tRNA dimethylallyltransferase [Firmicutes bacterium]|nr:tRNA dimethylallyltransferase [Bacillota bacterium]
MDRVIAIIGPTAVGKTKVGIDLAKKLSTEVISGDSMLIYRDMDIGTAKPDDTERAGIIHHLIDIRAPNEEYSVVNFQEMSSGLIHFFNEKNKIPILVGGTGLYVKSLLEGYKFNPVPGSEELRERLTQLAAIHGNKYLHTMLMSVRPDIADRLHPNDQRRIIRALEVHQQQQAAPIKAKSPKGLIFNAAVIGLTMERNKLYERINQRVDLMIQSGLISEVAGLLKNGVPPNCQAMQGIGYKEIVLYFQGELTLPEAIDKIKQATRNFAKRQLTWFRKMPYIHWVDYEDFQNWEETMEYIYKVVAGKFNLE